MLHPGAFGAGCEDMGSYNAAMRDGEPDSVSTALAAWVPQRHELHEIVTLIGRRPGSDACGGRRSRSSSGSG